MSGIVIEDMEIPKLRENSLPYTFHASSTTINTPIWRLLPPTPVIDNVHVHSPVLGIDMYESGGSDKNWQMLLNNMDQQASFLPGRQ